MFTIEDLNSVRSGEKTILDAVLFSIQKDEFAYALNLCNSHDRGTYTEKLLQNRLIERGFDVLHCGESGDYDLLIDNNVRAEVKLATIQQSGNSKRTQYIFHKIKPECFDIIFLVFLNPYVITIKWTNSEMITEWSKEGYKRGKNGYQITFNSDMGSKKLVYNETFDGFVNVYSRKRLLTKLKQQGIMVQKEGVCDAKLVF